jgi:TetR/AcrR family transcriptional regulator, transcriptional repressor for nem operon
MRKSKEEAAETRARIIRKASKEFNQHGIAGTGLADVMKSAGLTHGGFYKHFQSKDELVAEALERGLEKSFQAIEHSADERAIAELINEYLSPVHRNDFDNACPLPALGTELWRAGGKTRQKASEGVLRFVSLVEKHLKDLPAKDRRSRAHAIVAALVGSMMLSRIVTDPKLSDRLLRDTRDFVLRLVC